MLVRDWILIVGIKYVCLGIGLSYITDFKVVGSWSNMYSKHSVYILLGKYSRTCLAGGNHHAHLRIFPADWIQFSRIASLGHS